MSPQRGTSAEIAFALAQIGRCNLSGRLCVRVGFVTVGKAENFEESSFRHRHIGEKLVLITGFSKFLFARSVHVHPRRFLPAPAHTHKVRTS